MVRPGETTGTLPALVPLRERVYCQGLRFPETVTTSLGVLQLWPVPSSRLVFPKKSGCHDHISCLRTTCRTAAAGPRAIPRNPGAQINQAAGHAIIRGGTFGERHDAQGARDGELSVPQRRGRVYAIDHRLTNEPTSAFSVENQLQVDKNLESQLRVDHQTRRTGTAGSGPSLFYATDALRLLNK